MSNLDGLLWVTLALVALFYLRRSLHLEIQSLFLIVTGSSLAAVILFQLIFLPGVFLHEFSHLVMARLLGVRTGRFSLIPRPQGRGRLQMGYVEIQRADHVRSALIGLAPLLSGMAFLAAVAVFSPLRLSALWDILRLRHFDLFLQGLGILPSLPNFWLWFYLVFVVSSTMLPSPSDRHAWLPVGLTIGALFGLALLAGAGEWLLTHLAPPFNEFLRACALLLGLSALVHALLFLPFWMLRRLAARLFRRDVA